MEIITIPIDKLTPDPNNAKDHPKWQIDQIKNSIEQFGNLDPIGVWGDDNLIVEGHGRYEALKELGYQEAECIRLDWLTEEERTAYALAHNKLTMNSGFIPEALEMNLDAIGEIDMSLFGFKDDREMDVDAFGTDFELPDGDKPEICQMTFTLHTEQKDLIVRALQEAEDEIGETFGNTNKNGNALYEVVRQWEEQKK